MGTAFRRLTWLGRGLVAVLLLCACRTWHYDGREYSSQENVRAFQEQRDQRYLAALAPLPAPLAPRARLAMPRRSVFTNKALTGGRVSDREDFAEILVHDYMLLLRAIARRGIFQSVTYELTDGGPLKPRAGEAVVYFYIIDNAAGWYFESARVARTPLFLEHGNPEYAKRIQYFLDTIAALAAKSQQPT